MWEDGWAEWVENEPMMLKRTGGGRKELTQVSGDRNSKDRRFLSCKAVIQHETTYGVEIPKHQSPQLFRAYETGLKAMLQFLQLAGHMEKLHDL